MKKFLLLSDIHACDVDPSSSSAPSFVSSFTAAASGKRDPITELEHLVRESNLQPDAILCAGDITNRSHPGSLAYAWERLHKLASMCGAKLIATIGNHDLDSRYQANGFDPRGYAMSLRPSIPVEDRSNFLEYWAENFTLVADDNCKILTLNTAAYHGGGNDVSFELEHGRVSELTIAGIKAALDRSPRAPTNILLCHHHPIKADQGDHELVGLTRGGDKLVQALDAAKEPWILVHGHKHVPDLFYGHGGGNAPVILGCASFSAQVNADAQNKNPNQVHLLTSDPDAAAAAGLSSAGTVRSWTWQVGVGWSKARGLQGLPHLSGFGYRGNAKFLAQKLDQLLIELETSQVGWAFATSRIPELQMLIPRDFKALEDSLGQLSLTILRDGDDELMQVGRRP